MPRGRKAVRSNIFGAPRVLRDELLNLHDAFMNASLQRSRMLRSTMDGGDTPEQFFMSDRGRFERTYVAFLAVLVEAWHSPMAAPARAAIAARAPIQPLEDLLAQAKHDGVLERMRSARGYMFHRDERQYWDVGRVAVADLGGAHEEIYRAFSKMFLDFFPIGTAAEYRQIIE